jgi:hypothetical protein
MSNEERSFPRPKRRWERNAEGREYDRQMRGLAQMKTCTVCGIQFLMPSSYVGDEPKCQGCRPPVAPPPPCSDA